MTRFAEGPPPLDGPGASGGERSGAPPQVRSPAGNGARSDDLESEETYRGRMWAAAGRRRVPLATILTAVLVTIVVIDLNVLVILLLWVLRTVILYALMAMFLALLLSPAVHLVQRTGASHGLAATIVFLVTLLVVGGVIVLFTAPLVSAVTHFAKELPTLVQQAEHGKGRIGHFLTRLHLQNWVKKNAPKIASDITKSLKPAQALSVGSAALSTVVTLGAVAILTLFLLLDGPLLRGAVLGRLRPATAARVARVYRDSSRSVTGFMLGNITTSVIAGVVIAMTLLVMGVPYPLLLGLWVALVDLLPLVGGLLAGVPVVIIAAFHSLPALIVTVVVFLVYQQIENHILNPLIMSKTVRLRPLWVLVAILIAATLGGKIAGSLGAFVGALIGIPIGGAVQVITREVRRGPTAEPVVGAMEAAPAEPGAGDGI